MPRSISRPVLLLVSFVLLLGLYYPSLNGGPIWDDYHNIFYDSVVTGDFSYWKIFKNFAWPVSVSAEKVLYGLWNTEYFYYQLYLVAASLCMLFSAIFHWFCCIL